MKKAYWIAFVACQAIGIPSLLFFYPLGFVLLFPGLLISLITPETPHLPAWASLVFLLLLNGAAWYLVEVFVRFVAKALEPVERDR